MTSTLKALKDHQAMFSEMESLIPGIEAAAARICVAIQKGGKVFWMGNGGSAADAQHLAAELVGRFKKERRALPAIALTADSSILTALSNDYDYSIVFSRQIEALCSVNDVVIGISTSGNSHNVIAGIEAAKKIGAYTIGFAGQKGRLADLVDLGLRVPSENTARIQEAHIFIGHSICELVEQNVCVPSVVEDVCA